MPEISVIVPVYKTEKTIGRCVDSILGQSYKDFELILIEDGSPDNCSNICDEYEKKDSRIKVVHQDNSGVSIARNKGLDIALGRFVLFIDSDDYIDKDYIEQLYEHESDLTICGLVRETEDGDILGMTDYKSIHYEQKKKIDYVKLYRENIIYSPYCKLFLNQIIQANNIRFYPNVTWGEDGMFVADYLQYVDSIRIIEYSGYHYVKYNCENSLSTKVREDVVKMVGISRIYCVDKMKITSQESYEEVKSVCTEDMKKNGAYFVQKLFENILLSNKQKKRLLNEYMKESYIIETFKRVDEYYPKRKSYKIALEKKNAKAIIYSYYYEVQKQKIYKLLYRICVRISKIIKKILLYKRGD